MADRLPGSARRYTASALAYVGAYVALDWASYIHPVAELAITPWNPPPGLSLFLLLRCGLRYVPALFVAALAAEVLVRGVPSHPVLALASSLLLASGYAAAGAVLVGPLRIGRSLETLRDVNRFVATAGITPIPIALAYVGLHVVLGDLPAADLPGAVAQFWIGDAIGIIVTTPLLLEYAERRIAWRAKFDVELVLQAAAILVALWIVFGIEATDEFKYFYLLFLPLIWIAMRRGLRGAVLASLAIQLGLIAAAEDVAAKGILLRDLQFLMLTLALTALYLGMAVTARAAAERAVAARDNALNRALRMATAGELAAAVAHELNQPLSAIGTYVRACVLMLDRPAQAPLLRDTLDRVAREVARAGEVIRRLRDFYRTGSTRRERVAPASLVAAVVQSLAPRLAEHSIAIEIAEEPDLPAIDVDVVQMHAVLHNLIANAIDALADDGGTERRIRVTLAARPDGTIRCAVADTGPGIADSVAARLFEPFTSTKPGGMGLGLAMSRSIVEAHGGRLAIERNAPRGATFELVLPRADRRRPADAP
jgi:two-component system sensor kinase FixL